MQDIIEDCFGEIDTDMLVIPANLRKILGYMVVNTDHNKVETYYDRSLEWVVVAARLGEDDE